jgi:hypothetical protein
VIPYQPAFESRYPVPRHALHLTLPEPEQVGQVIAGYCKRIIDLKIEPAIMASEIERLPDLEGFIKTASIPDWCRVRLAPAAPNPRREPSPFRRGETPALHDNENAAGQFGEADGNATSSPVAAGTALVRSGAAG